VLKPYRALARWIAPTIHPFMDLMRAFFAGVPEVGAAEEEDQDGCVAFPSIHRMCIDNKAPEIQKKNSMYLTV
jgi:hypothetical protein